MSPDRFVVAVALFSIIGCATDEIALVSTGPLDDLVEIPQDATAFTETGGPPILEADERFQAKGSLRITGTALGSEPSRYLHTRGV